MTLHLHLHHFFSLYSIGGGELLDRVIEEEFVLTERACVCFMKQILEGVSYLHHQQIIHLDLKVSSTPFFLARVKWEIALSDLRGGGRVFLAKRDWAAVGK